MSEKFTILLVTFLELLLLSTLAIHIYHKKNTILGSSISVTPLNKANIHFVEDGGLHYFYELNPNSQVSQPVTYANHNSTQTINADTLNERFNYAAEKPQDTFRIITLGDSFTYGGFENTENNYPEQLEDLLNSKESCKERAFEVINLGVSGYDIEYEVERFKRRGQKYHADLVLWFIKDDDFNVVTELITPLLPKYRSGSWDEAINETITQYTEQTLKDYEASAMEEMLLYYTDPLAIFSFSTLQESNKNRIKNFVDANENVYFYDDLIHIYNDKQNFWKDTHPTTHGYSLIASDLFSYLQRNHIIPCD